MSATLAIVSAISVACLTYGLVIHFIDRNRVLFPDWHGSPVHHDEFFGLAGLVGCGACAFANVLIFIGGMLWN